MTSVEDAYRPAFREIARRSESARELRDAGDATAYFKRSSDALDLPFQTQDQAFALVSMGTSVLAPRPLDPLFPALRIYGAFATREEAAEHAALVREADAACSLVVVPMHTWALMPQTQLSRDDPVERERVCEVKLAACVKQRTEDTTAFDRAVQDHVERPLPTPPPAGDDDETREAEALVYPPPRRLRGGAEVRGQSAVALCVVPDAVAGEVLFKVLGCFETTADAENWARNVGTREVTLDDVHVARTCDWIYPNGEVRPASTQYRVEELQRIMDAAEKQPRQVKEYKQWKAEQDELARVRAEEADECAGAGATENAMENATENAMENATVNATKNAMENATDVCE